MACNHPVPGLFVRRYHVDPLKQGDVFTMGFSKNTPPPKKKKKNIGYHGGSGGKMVFFWGELHWRFVPPRCPASSLGGISLCPAAAETSAKSAEARGEMDVDSRSSNSKGEPFRPKLGGMPILLVGTLRVHHRCGYMGRLLLSCFWAL